MSCCVEVILPCLIFVKVTVVVNCVEIRSHFVVYRFTTILLWMECIHVFMVNVSYHIFKLTISGSSIFFCYFSGTCFCKNKILCLHRL